MIEVTSSHNKFLSLPVTSLINGEIPSAFDFIFKPALHEQLEGGCWKGVVFDRPF